MNYLTADALAAALAVRDLTDPAHGPHALQLLVDDILAAVPGPPPTVHRGERIVDIADNYDRLGYSPAAAARDSRYTRYVDGERMLRSQTSALIPGALRVLSGKLDGGHGGGLSGGLSGGQKSDGHSGGHDGAGGAGAVIACPGLVYRRDAIDRLHTGTPHQLDLWRIGERPGDLLDLVRRAVAAALPAVAWRTRPASHPYTTGGLEIEAWSGTAWVEIGECGIAAGHVLAGAGLPAGIGGLALGLGLDRLLMLRKGIDDIRLLRSADPRVAGQLTDLTPYRPVSAQPAAYRDLSVAMPAGVTAEDVGDRVRDLLGRDSRLVEEVTIVSTTPAADLPDASRERLAIRDGEVNVLIRVVLRDLHRSLPKQTANALRDRLGAGLALASWG